MLPTFPNLPDLLSEHLLSKFLPRSAHSQQRYQVRLSCQIDEFLINVSLKSEKNYSSKQPYQQSKELNVNNISLDPKCFDERCETAEAYKLHSGLSHGWWQWWWWRWWWRWWWSCREWWWWRMPCDLSQRTPLSRGTEPRCHALASSGSPTMMMTPETRRQGVTLWRLEVTQARWWRQRHGGLVLGWASGVGLGGWAGCWVVRSVVRCCVVECWFAWLGGERSCQFCERRNMETWWHTQTKKKWEIWRPEKCFEKKKSTHTHKKEK